MAGEGAAPAAPRMPPATNGASTMTEDALVADFDDGISFSGRARTSRKPDVPERQGFPAGITDHDRLDRRTRGVIPIAMGGWPSLASQR
jgi:hypothetical protein